MVASVWATCGLHGLDTSSIGRRGCQVVLTRERHSMDRGNSWVPGRDRAQFRSAADPIVAARPTSHVGMQPDGPAS